MKLCLLAVKSSEYQLNYVPAEKKTTEICMLALKQDGWTLEYIPEDKRTEDLCLIAVKQNGRQKKFVWSSQKYWIRLTIYSREVED